jgi:hypothetical protein
VLLFGAFLSVTSADLDPDDPGSADIAFVLSPVLAVIDAIVIGTLLVLLARARLIPITVGRARRALGAGVLLAPIAYLVVLIASASAIDDAHSGALDATVSFLVPAICATVIALAIALLGLRRRSSAG